MIVVDVLVVLVLVGALITGIRRGFFASIGTLAGLAVGGIAAFWLTPAVAAGVAAPEWRSAAVIGTVAGTLLLGAALGSAVGAVLRRGADKLKLRVIERVLGGLAGVAIAALTLALVAPAVTAVGIPVVSSAVASSRVLQAIDDITPDPIDAVLAEVRAVVLDDGLPQLGALLEPGNAELAAPVALDDPELAAAAASVARVSGTAYACGRSMTGTGFVAAPGRIITNAHVVAGVDRPVVELPGRGAREGRIVYFDPVDDLAVIAVDDLDAAALPVAEDLAPGTTAVVFGYPHGGPFTMTPAGVISAGTVPVPDIYDGSWNLRAIAALEARVRPGNSGGPLLTDAGAVAGVVFARSDTNADLGYAMTGAEFEPVIARAAALTDPVTPGRCVG